MVIYIYMHIYIIYTCIDIPAEIPEQFQSTALDPETGPGRSEPARSTRFTRELSDWHSGFGAA